MTSLSNSTRERRSGAAKLWDLVLLMIAAAVPVALVWRIGQGADLSDESYYATFIDAWLKEGTPGGASRVLHQTAALIVYPFALIFQTTTGGEDGLILFLRSIYLALGAVTAMSVFSFVAPLQDWRVGVGAGLFVLSFIPFSLPAPSYNTLGMMGVVAGLALTGRYLNRAASSPWPPALAWTVSSVAYPPLLFAAPVALLLCLLAPQRSAQIPRLARLGLALGALHTLAACLVLRSLGPGWLKETLDFTLVSLGDYAEPTGKLRGVIEILAAQPLFVAALCISAAVGVAAGVIQRPRGAAVCLAIMAALLPCTWALMPRPALFVRAHDAVALLIPFGFFAVGLARDMAPAPRLMALGAAAAGALTVLSATNALFNLPIGAFGVAVAGIAFAGISTGPSVGVRLARAALLATSVATVAVGAFVFFYGQWPDDGGERRQEVRSGAYAGLYITPNQAEYIGAVQALLAEHEMPGRITMVGRLPGTYLLTRMPPSALSTWNFSQALGPLPQLEARLDQFFADPANVPALIGQDIDPWTRQPTPAEARLLSGYEEVGRHEQGPRQFILYRRRIQ